AMSMGGATNGLLVEQHEGRPTKVEGNPSHPNSLGATDVFAQASVLSMYDPDRSTVLRKNGAINTYDRFVEEFRGALDSEQPGGGAGVRILTETVVSPTLSRQLADVFKRFPNAQIHHYEPAGSDSAREGNQIAFGQPVTAFYKLDEADVILSLDEDFLAGLPHNTRSIHDWASRRRPAPGVELNRTYVVESTHTSTGAKADHRMPLRARDIEAFARIVAARLGVDVGAAPDLNVDERFLNGLVADLQASAERSVVIPGRHQSAAVHALAHAMNETLRNVGTTVYHTEPVEYVPTYPRQPAAERPTTQVASLRALTEDMRQGKVKVLLIVGGNPVYGAPADIEFGRWLAARNSGNQRFVPMSAHLSTYRDETSELAVWHIPETHYLEAWSDARTFDGTVSIVQPLIEPLYRASKTPHELLTLFGDLPSTDDPGGPGYELVRQTIRSLRPNVNFEALWRQSLHSGVVDGSELPVRSQPVRPGLAGRLPEPTRDSGGLEVVFRSDPSLYDGRWANNGWLQELPKPISKLTWDNAVLLSPATARELGVKSEDEVTLSLGGRSVTGPVFELVGQPPGTATVHMGYGRNVAGERFKVGNNIGFNVNALRTAATMHFGTGATIVKTGKEYRLATTQVHHTIDDLDQGHIRHATALEYQEHPEVIREEVHQVEGSLYPEYDYDQPNSGNRHAYKWGMSIDMSTCTGCNACVVACQAENNSPVVGKEQVGNSREMHWLRVDSYFRGDTENPETYFQPMMCVQCEKAPCEVVCPVEATVHSIEGLNDMVYN
ncbi:MAG: 4Fe-4S dicluster domain-containing protein, partial [Chloroflexota bacterium]|nr:4Fe-4S dicluster domain-containing protein [Chloroflexota bacterium]